MSGTCVNPFCNHPFRHASRGKLFTIQFPPSVFERHHKMAGPCEDFWLCEECARLMTIAVRREFGAVSVRVINLAPNGATKLDFAASLMSGYAEPELLRSA